MLVLDANILIRAVLGTRVSGLLHKYSGCIEFLAPDSAFEEAREWLPAILARRGIAVAPALAALSSLKALVRTVDIETYAPFEGVSRQRLARRDQDDWPILATALLLDKPIWTEDTDFFGCGVATWTTETVELYLVQVSSGR